MIEFEQGSTNVYADLGIPDAEGMLRKAQLTHEISKIIKSRGWSQQQAAEVIGLSQPKLSELLRGQFRGISEIKMLAYLARLGCDVEIVVSEPRLTGAPGHVTLSIAA